MMYNQPTLKVNIRAQEERERRKKERRIREELSKIQATAGPATRPRKRKGLNFHEPGTFVSQGEQLRKKAKLEALQRRIAANAAKTGITDAAKLASLSVKANEEVKDEDIPDVECWDKLLLKKQSLDEVILKIDQNKEKPDNIFEGITKLIEHPFIKRPSGPDTSSIQVPIFLTKKERQKLRRQNRKIVELEKQEKIKFGLLPKPEAKLKRSNIMYALGNEAIINPSLADQMVRDQEEKRKQAHIEHNESKKLTLEEKRAKKLRKVQEDLSLTGTWTTVFRVVDMNSKFIKKKVQLNVEQLDMTGVLVLHKDINLVIVEGGPKQNRKFKHLMMDRINWSGLQIDATNNRAGLKFNKCLLVWEGQVQQRSFGRFTVKDIKSEPDVRGFFKQSGVENYWDLALQSSILQSIEET